MPLALALILPALAAPPDRGEACDAVHLHPPAADAAVVRSLVALLGDPPGAATAAEALVRQGQPAAVPAIDAAWRAAATAPPGEGAADSAALRRAAVHAWQCLGDAATAVPALLAIAAAPPPPAPGAPLTRQYPADPDVYAALAAFGPAARSAVPFLVDALLSTRFEEEEHRIGIDQEGATAIVDALVAIGLDDEAQARRILAWSEAAFGRARLRARWEDALSPAVREALAAPLRGALATAPTRWTVHELGRLGDLPSLSAVLLLALDPALPAFDSGEARDAVVAIAAAHSGAWSTLRPDARAALDRWYATLPLRLAPVGDDVGVDLRTGFAIDLASTGEPASLAFVARSPLPAGSTARHRVASAFAERVDLADPASVRRALALVDSAHPRALFDGPLGRDADANPLPRDTAAAALAWLRAEPAIPWPAMLLASYLDALDDAERAELLAMHPEGRQGLPLQELQLRIAPDPLALLPAPAAWQGDRSVLVGWTLRSLAVTRAFELHGCSPAAVDALEVLLRLPAATAVDLATPTAGYARACEPVDRPTLRAALLPRPSGLPLDPWLDAVAASSPGAAPEPAALAAALLATECVDAATAVAYRALAPDGAVPALLTAWSCGPDDAPRSPASLPSPAGHDRVAALLAAAAALEAASPLRPADRDRLAAAVVATVDAGELTAADSTRLAAGCPDTPATAPACAALSARARGPAALVATLALLLTAGALLAARARRRAATP